MSNTGQIGTAIVGGIVGWYVGGGPAGAAYGFQLGLAAGESTMPALLPSDPIPTIQLSGSSEAHRFLTAEKSDIPHPGPERDC